MTLRDLIVISFGNLWRMKLRTFLTTSGVLIAIAAFVSMISFGAGNQRRLEEEFNKLGLFTTMQVYPKSSRNTADTASYRKLDKAALVELAAIPGVNLVYPYDAINVIARLGDSTAPTKAQALPTAAVRTKLFSNLLAGSPFDSNSSRQAIVSNDLIKKFGIHTPDSAVGRSLILAVRVSVIDSGFAHILADQGETIWDRLKRIRVDSLLKTNYRSHVLRTEGNATLRRFLNGFLNAPAIITDTLTIRGVREDRRGGMIRTDAIIIPPETAQRFTSAGFSGNPADIFASMSAGTLFAQSDDPGGKSYSQVTIDFDPKVLAKTIRDSVEAAGFRAFSFAEQFEQIQKIFLYFDMALGVIGLIALFTASLGIVNTMVMSITERRREIGVLKSLGADESDIRWLFLVESGVIGFLGTVGGIFIGWSITRIVSAIAQSYMKGQGLPAIDLFALPLWLILIALSMGVGVAIIAGFYPAARAARVDPVEALRND
jgi:putative ABC transport system permease protein